MNIIASKYRKWKKDNPDMDRQYDAIGEFMAELSRGELLMIMEYLDKRIREDEEVPDELWRESN